MTVAVMAAESALKWQRDEHHNDDLAEIIEPGEVRNPKIYAGAPHGIAYTHKNQLNADLLAFLKT